MLSTDSDVTRIRVGLWLNIVSIAISNIGIDKSFVDDLNRKRGIVSMRVGFVLRSAEIKPLYFDLFHSNQHKHQRMSCRVLFLLSSKRKKVTSTHIPAAPPSDICIINPILLDDIMKNHTSRQENAIDE